MSDAPERDECLREDRERRRALELRRVLVDLLDARGDEGAKIGACHPGDLRVEDLLERVDDVVGGELFAVVELDARWHADGPARGRLVRRDLGREHRDGVGVLVELEERVVEVADAGEVEVWTGRSGLTVSELVRP